jgi:hypothetical protein
VTSSLDLSMEVSFVSILCSPGFETISNYVGLT